MVNAFTRTGKLSASPVLEFQLEVPVNKLIMFTHCTAPAHGLTYPEFQLNRDAKCFDL